MTVDPAPRSQVVSPLCRWDMTKSHPMCGLIRHLAPSALNHIHMEDRRVGCFASFSMSTRVIILVLNLTLDVKGDKGFPQEDKSEFSQANS